MLDRRFGKFFLDVPKIQSDLNNYLEALKDVLVLDARNLMFNNQVECIGYSRKFDVVNVGGVIPVYNIIIKEVPLGVRREVVFEKK